VKAVFALAQSILKTFSETLLLDSIRRFVKKSEGTASSLCLQLWQGLLVLQSTAQSMTKDETGNDEAFWKSAADTVNESREYLQELLPAHIFLASVTSLIKEGGTDEIRARALRLVADRVADVDPHSPEQLSFDLVPEWSTYSNLFQRKCPKSTNQEELCCSSQLSLQSKTLLVFWVSLDRRAAAQQRLHTSLKRSRDRELYCLDIPRESKILHLISRVSTTHYASFTAALLCVLQLWSVQPELGAYRYFRK
jgi:hypothetical protein